jgi:A/G-specific adenine glycosylase
MLKIPEEELTIGDMDNAEFQQRLLKWYDANARCLPWRDDPTPYRVWISEIMLQQTRVDTVKPYFDRFLSALPTVRDLAEADEQLLLKLWEGLGYYSRVRNLKKAAGEILEKQDGRLPASVEELIRLPGIGPYTAGAIASIAFGVKTPAIDGNVLRVIARITSNRGDLAQKETKEEIGKIVLELLPEQRNGDFNQALMELGATVCLPNGAPKCEICPVRALCSAYSEGATGQIPVKAKRNERKIEQKTILLILCRDRTAIRKRPDKGLLSGLWEFPNVDGHLTEHECRKVLRNWNIQSTDLIPLPESKHIFSHVEWHMTGYITLAEEDRTGSPDGFTWASPEELKAQYAVPTAFRAYLPYALESRY